MGATKDETKIDLSERTRFYIETYNQWIKNMINLSPEQIDELEKRNIDAKKMQEYLSDFGFVRTMEDIQRLKSNPLFEKEANGWELNDGWTHIKSRYITGRQETEIDVKHRLYIGCQNQDIWKMMSLFKEKCEQQGITYYFKSDASNSRTDKIVIYSDTKNLSTYISILQEIAKENPQIVQRCGNPPILTGKIDEWIGIGDEPPLKDNGKKQSYNTLRAEVIENAIEETLLRAIQEYKGKQIEYNGKTGLFDGLFIKQAADCLVANLTQKRAEELNITESDIKSGSLSEQIKKHLPQKIRLGLDKLWEVKDKKTELIVSNRMEIFSIPTRNGKKIDVNTLDMDKILRAMLPIIQQIDPQFMDKVKKAIDEKCNQAGIDSTFCFGQQTKAIFEQVDSIVAKQEETRKVVQHDNSEGEISQQDSFYSEKAKRFREEQQATKQQILHPKEKTVKQINSVGITALLNPSLLKQRILLPNGAEISANQYIQEIVAPHIPKDGKFTLKNGAEISAKQFIEEFVLSNNGIDNQGNIEEIIEQYTKANNGIINCRGNEINAVDIVGSLNQSLMNRGIQLPNGVEILASQYIQEVVAPYIPRRGMFILKNGAEIPATQFIEEVLLSQIGDYQGDIRALLEGTTKANNGVIEIEDKIKTSRYKGKQQEIGLSQAQQEKLQRDAEARQRIEKEGQQGVEQAKTPKKITKQALHSDIVDTKISTSKKDKSMQKTRNIFEAQLLYNKLKKGEQLSAQDQQVAMEYGQKLEERRRAQRKSKGQSMGR